MTPLDFLPMDAVTYFRSSQGLVPMVHAEVVNRVGAKCIRIRIKAKDGSWYEKIVRAEQCEKGKREGAREWI